MFSRWYVPCAAAGWEGPVGAGAAWALVEKPGGAAGGKPVPAWLAVGAVGVGFWKVSGTGAGCTGGRDVRGWATGESAGGWVRVSGSSRSPSMSSSSGPWRLKAPNWRAVRSTCSRFPGIRTASSWSSSRRW